ncbi:MAG: TolC family protein [Chitinophagaceae bacterium]|jgi:outer membrane protein TolC|nr:TolC family protein [Chitinophagaceae bacterium]
MNHKIFSLIAFLFTGYLSGAQQINPELKSLANTSFGYFPQVKEAENTIVTAQNKIDIAGNRLPVVVAQGSYDYVRPKIEIPFPLGPNGELINFMFAPINNYDGHVAVSYSLLDFGRIKANVDKAKSDLQLATHNVQSVKEQLAYQVANIYYNVIFYHKAITIQDTVIAYLNENKRIVTSKLKNGDAIKLDLLNIQANIDAAENSKVDLQNALQKQLALLSYTTGAAQLFGAAFDFDIPVATLDAALSQTQNNNTDYLLAKDRILQAQKDMDVIKSENHPSLDLQGISGVKNGYVPDVNQAKFNYAMGAVLKVPIFDGNRVKKQLKLNESIVKQNELAVETLDNNYKKDIRQALIDIQTNQERIKNTEGQIQEAKAAEAIASSRFINGIGINLEITNASANLQRAEFTRLQYEYQLCLAKVNLAKLMGYKYWQ